MNKTLFKYCLSLFVIVVFICLAAASATFSDKFSIEEVSFTKTLWENDTNKITERLDINYSVREGYWCDLLKSKGINKMDLLEAIYIPDSKQHKNLRKRIRQKRSFYYFDSSYDSTISTKSVKYVYLYNNDIIKTQYREIKSYELKLLYEDNNCTLYLLEQDFYRNDTLIAKSPHYKNVKIIKQENGSLYYLANKSLDSDYY